MNKFIYGNLALDIFFDANTNTTDSVGLAPEQKEFYSKNVIANAEPELIHNKFGDKYPIPKNNGKVIEFRRFSPLKKALTPLVDGVTPKGDTLEVTTVTGQVKQYGKYVSISDQVSLTSYDPVLTQASKLIGQNAGLTIDTVTREILNGGTNVMYVPSVENGVETAITSRKDITVKSKLRPKDVKVAANILKRMNTPKIEGGFVAIIHPDVSLDIMTDDEFIDVVKYKDPEKVYDGEIGKIGGVRFFESSEAKIFQPQNIFDKVCRMELYTALNSTGSTNIFPDYAISTEQAAELTQRITDGETVQIYVGGNLATISSVTAGAVGVAKFVVAETIKNVEAGAVICGTGAGKDGSAVYSTLVIGSNAYGVTDITGGGLEYIFKPLGSGDDPLNQRCTSGWKSMHSAIRLVEAYMVRIESASETMSATATQD